MARTDISICSRALMNLGASPLNSFDDTGDVAKFLKLAYPEIRSTVISSYQWECMKTITLLTREAGSPIGYRHAFLMPSGMIGAPVAIYISDQPYQRATSGFEVRGRRILANHEALWCEFSAEKPEDQWPAWFATLVVGAVCTEIAFMVTDSQTVKDYWDTVTYGTPSDERLGGLMGQAMTLDAQGSGNNPGLYNNEFVEARWGAAYPGDWI